MVSSYSGCQDRGDRGGDIPVPLCITLAVLLFWHLLMNCHANIPHIRTYSNTNIPHIRMYRKRFGARILRPRELSTTVAPPPNKEDLNIQQGERVTGPSTAGSSPPNTASDPITASTRVRGTVADIMSTGRLAQQSFIQEILGDFLSL